MGQKATCSIVGDKKWMRGVITITITIDRNIPVIDEDKYKIYFKRKSRGVGESICEDS